MILHTIFIDDHEPFTCREDTSVMRTMCEKRIPVQSYGCCGGGCGVCKMKIISGRYKVISRMSRTHISLEDEQSDIVLLCCITPLSDLRITVNVT